MTETDAVNYSDESAQADGSFDDVDDISMTAADADNTAVDARMDRQCHPEDRNRIDFRKKLLLFQLAQTMCRVVYACLEPILATFE